MTAITAAPPFALIDLAPAAAGAGTGGDGFAPMLAALLTSTAPVVTPVADIRADPPAIVPTTGTLLPPGTPAPVDTGDVALLTGVIPLPREFIASGRPATTLSPVPTQPTPVGLFSSHDELPGGSPPLAPLPFAVRTAPTIDRDRPPATTETLPGIPGDIAVVPASSPGVPAGPSPLPAPTVFSPMTQTPARPAAPGATTPATPRAVATTGTPVGPVVAPAPAPPLVPAAGIEPNPGLPAKGIAPHGPPVRSDALDIPDATPPVVDRQPAATTRAATVSPAPAQPLRDAVPTAATVTSSRHAPADENEDRSAPKDTPVVDTGVTLPVAPDPLPTTPVPVIVATASTALPPRPDIIVDATPSPVQLGRTAARAQPREIATPDSAASRDPVAGQEAPTTAVAAPVARAAPTIAAPPALSNSDAKPVSAPAANRPAVTATVASVAPAPTPLDKTAIATARAPVDPIPAPVPITPTPVIAPPSVVVAAVASRTPVISPSKRSETVGVATASPADQRAAPAAQPRAVVMPAAVPAASPAPAILPALQAFGAALHRAVVVERRTVRDPDATAVAAPTATLAPADPTPVDTTQPHWPEAMMARIERLRDAHNETDTSIRLHPDALGTIDVTVRQDAGGTHVRLTAAEPATRTLLADAQPRLQELAESRGLRLAGSDVAGGSANANGWTSQDRRQPAPATPRSAPRSAPTPEPTDDSTDTRIA